MGKNPNAKKLKEKRHKEKVYETNIDDLEEEAAKRGISVYELEQIRNKKRGDESDADESSEEEQQQNKKVKQQ